MIKLLFATGASSFIPPIENLRTANNVIGLRNLDDAIRIKEIATKVKNVSSSRSRSCWYRCIIVDF